jgi:two-component system NtrC family sensor kinase
MTHSGTEIQEEVRDKLFEVGKGTGQGLALARAVIVESYGGTLTFVVEMGKGRTFVLRLPLCATGVKQGTLVRERL